MAKMIVAKKLIKKGDLISLENITFKSPCIGIDASEYKEILGTKASNDLVEDEPITFNKLI